MVEPLGGVADGGGVLGSGGGLVTEGGEGGELVIDVVAAQDGVGGGAYRQDEAVALVVGGGGVGAIGAGDLGEATGPELTLAVVAVTGSVACGVSLGVEQVRACQVLAGGELRVTRVLHGDGAAERIVTIHRGGAFASIEAGKGAAAAQDGDKRGGFIGIEAGDGATGGGKIDDIGGGGDVAEDVDGFGKGGGVSRQSAELAQRAASDLASGAVFCKARRIRKATQADQWSAVCLKKCARRARHYVIAHITPLKNQPPPLSRPKPFQPNPPRASARFAVNLSQLLTILIAHSKRFTENLARRQALFAWQICFEGKMRNFCRLGIHSSENRWKG